MVTGLADSGAQMCVTGLDVAARMGIATSELVPCKMTISVADDAGLQVRGAAFLTLTGRGGVSCGQMVYFAEGLEEFFVSKVAMRDLGIIDEEFPRVGSCLRARVNAASRRRSSSQPAPLTDSSGNLGESSLSSGVYDREGDIDDDAFVSTGVMSSPPTCRRPAANLPPVCRQPVAQQV